jgi:hypothetical protein
LDEVGGLLSDGGTKNHIGAAVGLVRGTYALSKNQLWSLFAFNTAVAAGTLVTILVVLLSDRPPSAALGIALACAAGGGAGSIAYTRRLYKAAMDGRLVRDDQAAPFENAGSMVYFFSRPIFGAFFALVATSAAVAGMVSAVDGPLTIDEAFLYMCVVLGFGFGFSTGVVLTEVDRYTAALVRRVFRENEQG